MTESAIQVGTREIQPDDAVRPAGRTRAATDSVLLQTWAGLLHVFQTASFLPEARQAPVQTAEFCAGLFPSAD